MIFAARTNKKVKLDGWLLCSTLSLLGLSCLMVYSTTAPISLEHYSSAFHMLGKHLAHIVIGLLAYIVASKLSISFLRKVAVPGFFFGLILLVLVLVPGLGQSAGGAQRWLSIGPLRFQPGELIKLFSVLYMASYIARQEKKMFRFIPGTLIPFAIIAVMSALLLLEPDFGTTAIVSGVVFCQLLTVSRISHMMALGFAGAAGAASLILTSPYRLRRLEAFLNPLENASGSGYQLVQSLVAISSGGLTGEGLGAGRQKLHYLPAAHTDFIFSIIAEELGLLGSILVVSLFLIIGFRGLQIAKKHIQNRFICSLSVGLTMLIVLPAILNVGVVSGLLPTKGLVLPLVAYGGTAMVVNLFVIGLLTGLARDF